MAVAKVLGEGPRGWIACNILRSIQWHHRNASLFYHAELRIKYELLMAAGQVRRPRCRCGVPRAFCSAAERDNP